MSTAEAQLAALRALAAELPAAPNADALVERALSILATLLPRRALCVRVLDIRSREPAKTGTAPRRATPGPSCTTACAAARG